MIRILTLAVVAASLTLASCATPKKDSCCAKPAATKAAGAKCDSCEKDKAKHAH